MSTTTLQTPDWLPLHNYPVAELMIVVCGQLEESGLPPNGWWTIWCHECGGCSEPFKGSLSSFAELLDGLKWHVESLERSQVICPDCQRAEPNETWAAQYRDGSGGTP